METTWLDTISPEPEPTLEGNITTDVAIIGGGITGITSAYLLSKLGKSVVLIEKGSLQSSATAYTTAFITYVIDTPLNKLIKMFGEEKARGVWQSGKEAIDQIETIIDEEHIVCDFKRCNEYIFATRERELEEIKKEIFAAKQLGFSMLLSTESDGLPFKNEGFALLPNQAKFHPLKYMLGLRDRARKNGALFFDNTEALSLEVNSPVILKTKTGTITVSYVLIATYDPFNHPPKLFAHKGPYVSYVVDIELPRNTLSEALYLDKKNPYHYFRVDRDNDHDYMILGGADHREEIRMNPEKNYQALESFFKKLFPHVPYSIRRKWTGPILEPVDGLPYIGSFSSDMDHHIVATGFSGNGMTYSMITAQLFKDVVLGKTNPWAYLYDPKRKLSFYQLWEKGVDYVEEFFGGAVKNIFRY